MGGWPRPLPAASSKFQHKAIDICGREFGRRPGRKESRLLAFGGIAYKVAAKSAPREPQQ